MSTSITVGDLLQKIDRGDKFLLLDVRNAEAFAKQRVQGSENVRPEDLAVRPAGEDQRQLPDGGFSMDGLAAEAS